MKQTKLFTLLAAMLMLFLPVSLLSQSTAYVSTYDKLRTAIGNVSVNNIVLTANIDVPCETSGNAGNTDLTGGSTAQLIINRSLTLQSQAGSKYIIKRVAANGADATKLKSLIAVLLTEVQLHVPTEELKVMAKTQQEPSECTAERFPIVVRPMAVLYQWMAQWRIICWEVPLLHAQHPLKEALYG